MEPINLEISGVLFSEKDDPDFIKKCRSLSEYITAGKVTVLHLIENLGFLLTHSSFMQREFGVLILSEVLNKIRFDCLNPEQIIVLAVYYSDKLKDHHQVVVAALKGTRTLLQFKNISDESVIKLINAIFQNVTCQQQQQPDRYVVYNIFENLLKQQQTVVKSMGIDFVYGVISAIDGERDPKNLKYLFEWIPLFLKSVSLGHLSEEMFEVLACYFPVDFKAPPQDPNKITRETLASALCPCLTAIPEFAEFCLPLALEKLDSSLKIAKLDSLDLIRTGCKTFPVSSYLQHSIEIWSQLQKEILNKADTEVHNECLKTFSAFISKLDETEDSSIYEKTVNDVVDTLRGNLLPNSKLFQPSSEILIAVAHATPKSSIIVAKKIGPLLENTFSLTSNMGEKIYILNALVEFFKACVKCNTSLNIEELAIIPVLCLEAVQSTSDELKIVGFNSFTDISGGVVENIRMNLLNILHLEILCDHSKSVQEAMFKCLATFARLYFIEVNEIVLYKTKIENVNSLNLYFKCLNAIADVEYFSNDVTNIYFKYLVDDNMEYSKITTINMKQLLQTKLDSIAIYFYSKGFIETMINYAIIHQNDINSDCDFLTDVSTCLKLLIAAQTSDVQKEIITRERENVNNCIGNECVYISLLSGVLSRIYTNVLDDFSLIDSLFEITLRSGNDFVRVNGMQLLANILNKMTNDMILNEKLAVIRSNCFTVSNLNILNSIMISSWVTKALLMRNHSQSNSWIEMLISLLENHREVSLGLRLIMDDSCEDLSVVSHCNKISLYRQKFFIITTNKLSEHYGSDKKHYLEAIGYIIENAPKPAVVAQFPKIIKLVLLCLNQCKEPDVLCVLLTTLNDLTTTQGSVLESHLDEFVTKILNLCEFEKSMKVRIAAIQCLAASVESFPIYKLLPLKQTVINKLGSCLDDKKRLVRKEATEARTLWFLLDAPI